MKIVHIITRMILGGAQENTLLTCEGLHERGYEITLITGPALGAEGQLMDRARGGGYQLIELGCLRRQINPFHDVPGYYRLKKLLAELDPDIVHTHSAKGGILGRWAAAALRDKTPQACCGVISKLDRARQRGSVRPRVVHTIHGMAFHPYQSAWLNQLYIAVERTAARRTDAFISVAEAMTRQALAAGLGRPEQYTKVFSGLEMGQYLTIPSAERIAQIRAEFRIPADALVVVSVARLAKLKGHEYIIESARQIAPRHPNVIWLFVGDGNLRARIENQISAAHLAERFRLAGLVPPQRVAELLHASDILVHCSLREGLARVLPQALLCGKAVISFDVDGAAEVVTDGQTGLLIPPRNVAALIEAQEKLIAEPELRAGVGPAGRKRCRQEFDHRVMVDRIEGVYQRQVQH